MSSDEGASCANPLYLGFIKEEWDLAKLRNSKSETVYKKAYMSLSSCPLKFSHPCETKQLKGIGDKIVNQLTQKLRAHYELLGQPMPKKPNARDRKRVSSNVLDPLEEVPKVKKARKQKPYVPSRRTGPYAVLIALSSLREDTIQSMSKEQVIHLAQPHCDSSFTESDKGSHYTAWASMRTLIDKDLVHERGRPQRNYALSEEGWETARRIRLFEKGEDMSPQEERPQNDIIPNMDRMRGARVQDKDIFIPIDDIDVGDMPRELEQRQRKEKTHIVPEKTAPFGTLGAAPADTYGSKAFTTVINSRKRPEAEIVELSSSPEPEPRISQTVSKIVNSHAIEPRRPQSPTSASPSVSLASPTKGLPDPDKTLSTAEAILIPPGTFEVRLILDNREIKNKECRESIINGLSKMGTPAFSRPLAVGDAIWVARMRDEDFLSKYHEEGRELVLDWIVERKRRDDLVGSIKDGRFHEQKFRLRRSGARNIVYLLEHYHLSEDNERAFGEKINSSIVSMQVVNDFFVKRTLGNDDTIRYLSQMTKYLKEEYESKPLYMIPSSVLTPSTYLPLLEQLRSDPANAERTHTITMPSFESLASKSDTLTLRDVFLKMLMCTKGLTGDKAIAIQKIWPTPIALIEAFEQCEDQKQREMMVEKQLGKVVGRHSVKSALSTKMSRIWAS